MTADWDAIWRHYHEASRLNRYQREELDALEKLLHTVNSQPERQP